MTGMLASVANLAEASQVARAGADIIDLKNPAAGSLGALPVKEVSRIVKHLSGGRSISATIGDLPMDPAIVLPAIKTMASSGVDYVKIGFFPGGDWAGVIHSLKPLTAGKTRLIAVLFGDYRPELHWIAGFANAGFAGTMLDTLDKRQGTLREVCAPGFLREFVRETQSHGLLCGLAGSLRAGDIPPLLALDPDYLGFRGALCGGKRTASVDIGAMRSILRLVSGRRFQPPRPVA